MGWSYSTPRWSPPKNSWVPCQGKNYWKRTYQSSRILISPVYNQAVHHFDEFLLFIIPEQKKNETTKVIVYQKIKNVVSPYQHIFIFISFSFSFSLDKFFVYCYILPFFLSVSYSPSFEVLLKSWSTEGEKQFNCSLSFEHGSRFP